MSRALLDVNVLLALALAPDAEITQVTSSYEEDEALEQD